MQSMQRQFGKLWNKGPGDNAKVSVLLNDYEDADKVLAQLIDNARSWRDSWASLVNSQLQIVTEYEGLYDPIVGATDGHGKEAALTPQVQLERTFRLKQVYSELKTELTEEIAMIDSRVVKPATDARDCIAPIRKTIKKRENKRLDYEKLQEKVMKLQRKPGRTSKEDASLAKAQDELTRVAEEFGIADEHLRTTLPPIITATFNMVPPLQSQLVLLQNRLLGLYYTSLHGYCEEAGFPSPPPPMSEVIATWSSAFQPIQREIESISFIARGRSIHQPLSLGNDPQGRKASIQAPSNGFRRTPSGLIASTNNTAPQPRTLRIPSGGSASQDTSPQRSPTYKRPDYLAPTDFTTATALGGATIDRSITRSPGRLSPGDTRTGRDYFGSNASSRANTNTDRSVSPSPYRGVLTPVGHSNGNTVSNGGSYSGGPVVKKKPPPPPPPKRIQSNKLPEEYVVAQYAFKGQGTGDLSFQEGDRIKIVKKTDTDQDWWVGELNGRKGSFPANYCKPT
ncbi:protein hob1 [Naviculisporaceae sp. PSN 640]